MGLRAPKPKLNTGSARFGVYHDGNVLCDATRPSKMDRWLITSKLTERALPETCLAETIELIPNRLHEPTCCRRPTIVHRAWCTEARDTGQGTWCGHTRHPAWLCDSERSVGDSSFGRFKVSIAMMFRLWRTCDQAMR